MVTFNPSAPILLKKKKSLNVTWSDEEPEGSQEDDDHVNNYIAFNLYTDQDAFADSVTTTVATALVNIEKEEVESKSDSSNDGEDLTNDAIQEAYRNMFNR